VAWLRALAIAVCALPLRLNSEATTVTTSMPSITERDRPVLISTTCTGSPSLMNATLFSCSACRMSGVEPGPGGDSAGAPVPLPSLVANEFEAHHAGDDPEDEHNFDYRRRFFTGHHCIRDGEQRPDTYPDRIASSKG
jgi:hypothetical protein